MKKLNKKARVNTFDIKGEIEVILVRKTAILNKGKKEGLVMFSGFHNGVSFILPVRVLKLNEDQVEVLNASDLGETFLIDINRLHKSFK